MKWSAEAEKAIRKVPFFVKKKARERIEKTARRAGHEIVSLKDVQNAKQEFLSNMESDIKGYRIEACFGSDGCPNRVMESRKLFEKLEKKLTKANLYKMLQERVDGPLKYHHEFGITLADCPNACSRPQIRDIGIIGADIPRITDKNCSMCEACVETCRENAIRLDKQKNIPEIDKKRCLYCGQCRAVCTGETIQSEKKGYRVLIGGKLGRHPRLGIELPGIYDENEVLAIVDNCLDYYKKNCRAGERFAALVREEDIPSEIMPNRTP